MEKRTYTLVVRAKTHSDGITKIQDWGLGPGVLTRADCTFTDRKGQGFDTYSFEVALRNAMEERIHDAVECYVESITHETPTKNRR